MKVIMIQTIPIRIPLKLTFAQSNNQASVSSSVILTVLTDKGVVGYGECCPREYVTGETVKTVTLDVQGLNREGGDLVFHSLENIKSWVLDEAPSKVGLATLCAIEMALLDSWSKEEKQSLIEGLGGERKEVFTYTGVVPLGNVKALKPVLEKFSFKRIKLKINHDLQASLEKIQLVKELYGPDTEVQVDVNAGWTLQDACVQLPELIQAGVSCIEQPFPTDKDEQMGWLTWKYGKEIDIMADESACSYRQIQQLVENGLCNKLNLKLSKNGGIFHCMNISKLAKAHGVSLQLGAHFGETSLLTAAAMLFSSLERELTSMEGGLGTHLLKHDVVEKPLMINRLGQISMAKNNLPLGWGPVLADRLHGIALS